MREREVLYEREPDIERAKTLTTRATRQTGVLATQRSEKSGNQKTIIQAINRQL